MKLVFPVNDSDNCKSGIRWAQVKLLRPTDSIVLVTHNPNPSSNSAAKLVEFFQNAFFSKHEEVETCVLLGDDPKSLIKNKIESCGADLCIIGSRGNKGLKKVAGGGSFAEFLVKSCSVPVLVSKHDITHMEVSPVRSICFPIDKSERSAATLKWANTNLLQKGDDITLITVEKMEGNEAEAKAMINQYALDLLPSHSCKGSVLYDGVKESLLSYMNQQKPDICVIGTRGLKGLQKIFVGSVTEFLLNSVDDVPILVLHG